MSKRKLVFASVVAVAASGAGVALATPGSGIIASPIIASAAFLDRVNIRVSIKGDDHSRESVQVRDAENTVMQQIIFAPNGQTGWHSHPGPAVALVKSGQLTLYSGDDETCTGRTFLQGQAFISSGQGTVHLARNQSSTENTEVWVTYFDVPPGTPAPVRVDAADPGNCSF